jgi:hypothetical protein
MNRLEKRDSSGSVTQHHKAVLILQVVLISMGSMSKLCC